MAAEINMHSNYIRRVGHVYLNLIFVAKFPIGLHMILQIHIKKISELPNILCANYFDRKSVGVQLSTPLEVFFNELCL